jgi:hypothetical protein
LKDIYELLNEIDIDEKEFEEMEVTELENAKVKKELKKSLNEKKKDEKATKLIITPHITLREYTSENFGSVEITENGEREIPIPFKPGKGKEEFVLDDIIIELEK